MTGFRPALAIAAAAAALALAGCGGASSTHAGPSHADRVACRTIFRIQQARDIGHGLPVFAPGAVPQALTISAEGTSQPLNRDMKAAAQQLVAVNTPTTAQLAQMERDCGKLGITAKNAQNVSS